MNREVCTKVEQVIYNAMISRGDKVVKRVFSDTGVTLHFEGSLGYPEESVKYVIDISGDSK